MEENDLLSAALNQSGLKPEDMGLGGAANLGAMSEGSHLNSPYYPYMNNPMNQMSQMLGGNMMHHNMMGGNMGMPNMNVMPPSIMANMFKSYQLMQQAGRIPKSGVGGLPEYMDPSSPYFRSMMNSYLQSLQSMRPDIMAKAWAAERAKSALQSELAKTEGEEGDEEEDELGHAETYADYMPAKLKVGQRHPDPVVETSSLSSVTPPDVWYTLTIPEEVMDRTLLSALQLEAITYASQQHEKLLPDGTRAGFLIGDGAGVGKGRTLAGIIYENYLLGRKRALWLSVSNDLKYDSERDLRDIGASKIEVNPLNKFKYAKISSKLNGSCKKGVIFATYSSLIGESQSGGKYRTRLKQLLHWCGDDFDGVIVFDECHKAKNLCPTGSGKPSKTGLTVLELQNRLPKARVVYASATGASEPKNMAYMTRLGLWGEGTPFREFTDFIMAVEKRGVGAMELVAMDMKLRGMYIARQLSFAGVTFKIEEIPLSKDFVEMYDASVDLWVDGRAKFQQAIEIMDGDNRSKKTMWGQFWASHQRFFKYLCIASKVRHAVQLSREAVKNGKCVVIGLQSTGEARTLEQLEEAGGELTDFVSTAKGVFQTLIEKHFPAPNRKKMMRLLGLDSLLERSKSPPKSPGPTTSSGVKRKPVRQARQGVKRYKEYILSDESSLDGRDSDFAPSNNNSEVEESDDNYSPNASNSEHASGDDDFNPFGEDSDSDEDPWATRKQKGSKKQKIKKKPKKSKENGAQNEPMKAPPADAVERAIAMKESLLIKLEKLGDRLPPNTLDQLIDDLGGTENVAEMTGRKGRVVSNEDGSIQYESRSEVDAPLETLNITEKQRFMNGEKRIAIISEAASSGISLQADRRVKNQSRRVHLTLELPWSADRAIQQFGRTHRSNQVNAPEYLFLISDLAGERRFASIVAKRLESLGALTHGDRRATESRDLSRFNIDNKYGRTALETVMRAVMEMESPLVPPPSDYEGDFFADIRECLVGVGLVVEDPISRYQSLDKDFNNMSKFLNRILGMPVKQQNLLFKYFTDTLEAIISQAKKAGRFDLGILDLGAGGDKVKKIRRNIFIQRHATGTASTELHTVSVERGLSWSEALEIWKELTGKDEGFFISNLVRNNHKNAVLVVADTQMGRRSKGDKIDKDKYFRIYRPNTGLQAKHESLSEIKAKYKKASNESAQIHWEEQFDAAEKTCSHIYWYGTCRRSMVGFHCEIGLRSRVYHVLSGSVLSVWNKVESVLSSVPGTHSAKLQVVRMRTEDGLRIVGSIIPSSCIQPLITVLSQDAMKTHVEEFQKDDDKKDVKKEDKDDKKDVKEAKMSLADTIKTLKEEVNLSDDSSDDDDDEDVKEEPEDNDDDDDENSGEDEDESDDENKKKAKRAKLSRNIKK